MVGGMAWVVRVGWVVVGRIRKLTKGLAKLHRHFDILAVLDDFVERRYTKKGVMQLFAPALVGTPAFDEGQFASRLFVLRKTRPVFRVAEVLGGDRLASLPAAFLPPLDFVVSASRSPLGLQ